MAKKVSLAPRKKKPTIRKPKFVDEKYIGSEPTFDAAMSNEEIVAEKRRGFTYYNYFYTAKDLKKNLVVWMQKNKYTKKDVQIMQSCEDWRIGITACGLATMLLNGLPDINNDEDNVAWLNQRIGEILDYKKQNRPKAIKKKTAVQPNIQEKIRDKALEQAEIVEEFVYQYSLNPKTFRVPDVYAYFKEAGVNQATAKYIQSWYQEQIRDYEELLNPPAKPDDYFKQLKEGYSHMAKSDIKKGHALYTSIIEACEKIVGDSKGKARKPRIRTPEQITKGVKYLAKCDKYNLASIDPTEILNCRYLWIFNTKTRKLGCYVAEPNNVLGVKGTTIVGYVEKDSIAKTLRKPEIQISETFKGASASYEKKFRDIKAIETKLNGRLNDHIVILKAIK